MKVLKRLCWYVAAPACMVVGVYAAYNFWQHSTATSASAVTHTGIRLASSATTTSKDDDTAAWATTLAEINSIIAAHSDIEVSASLVDLDTGQTYEAGESDVVFKAASTAKLIAAASYLHEVELGTATLDQYIGGTSARENLRRMIENSDNTAWAAINDYLGDKQAAYAESIGLTSFTGGDYNTMTSGDLASLLKQLYDGTLLSKVHRELLLSYMAESDASYLIADSFPGSATVYHKYGQLWGNLHDAAIIDYNGKHVALVVYTKSSTGDTSENTEQTAIIDQIAAAVATQMAP